MEKFKVELTQVEYEIINHALKAAAIGPSSMCLEVMRNIKNQLDNPPPEYYLVVGVLDDGITRTREAAIVKAKNMATAMEIARKKIEAFPGERFSFSANAKEATEDYLLKDIL